MSPQRGGWEQQKPAHTNSKGDTIMKRMTGIAFLALASTLGIGSASAQMQSRRSPRHGTLRLYGRQQTASRRHVFHSPGKRWHHSDSQPQGDSCGDDSGIRERQPVEGMRGKFRPTRRPVFYAGCPVQLRCDQHQSSCFQSREENSSGSGKSARQRRPGPDRSQVGFAKRKPRKTIKARTFPPPGLYYCCSLNT